MPVYTYKALTEAGDASSGIIDADSPREARQKLRHKKLHVTELMAAEEAKGRVKRRRVLFQSRRREDVAMITRQLATLLGSGIPLVGAFTALIEQADFEPLKASLMDVRERISQGSSLSEAMQAHPHYFNELYVNMVAAGEAGGNLDRVLYQLADFLHAQNRTRAKVVAALSYPVMMFMIGVVVVLILITAVVPKILDVIQKESDAALPLPTEILVALSGFMGSYWWALLGLAVALYLAYLQARRTREGRLWIDSVKLEIPVAGNLIRKAAISRFAVTLATLLESGLPVLDALVVVRRVVDNALLAEAIETVRQRVAEGADIATPIKANRIFPSIVGYMVAVGEESGRLEELLKKTAQAYDEEVEIAGQKLTALLEPAIIVFMAVVVGFIVLSVMLPIIQMSNM